MRVAVVIPCLDEGELVAEAVASIREEEPVEIVVVDDASTDPAHLAVLERLEAGGVRVVRHERNRDVAAARQTGVAATTAPYVLPLDADDLAVPGALAAMADRLDGDPGAAVCFGDYEELGEGRLVRAVPDWLDPFRVAYTNEYPITALYRRSVLDAVGGWLPNDFVAARYEDWNLWMTLAERGVRGVHLGRGRLTYRRRVAPDRRLDASKRDHVNQYAALREAHPRLFAELDAHRRRSDLGRVRKLAYPIVYGGRRRHPFERRLKAGLDRLGVWTLRR